MGGVGVRGLGNQSVEGIKILVFTMTPRTLTVKLQSVGVLGRVATLCKLRMTSLRGRKSWAFVE